MPLNSLHADICILQIGAVQAERVYIFVQWKFCIGTIKMSITSAYIECTTAKRYHSIELANSFLLKSRYWTFAKITASALWNKFECLALLLCLSIHVLSCIIVWRIETHVHVWLCACVTVHVWLCACWHSYHSWFLLMEIVFLCLVSSITCKVHDSLEFSLVLLVHCGHMTSMHVYVQEHIRTGDLSKSM